MTLNIDLNHPIFLLKNKIQEISKNLFENFGFNYFQYLRCFADGSINCLTNNTGLFEFFQQIDNEPVVFSSFETEHENNHAYWFLWDDELPSLPVHIAREQFNLHNGLTFVRRNKNYYDMIAVALPYEHPNPASFYLNKFKAIEQFIFDFDLQHKDLIQILNKNPIALPQAYRDVNYKDICLTQGRINLPGKKSPTYLTVQEISCLRLLLQGATHKQIAQILELSPRTVDTYLLRIKHRTGFTSKLEMERMLSLCSSF
ncbi:transcription regulator protein, response regulator containing CheY-like receiver domain and HTH DNA-binding domain [Legionella wadsworthii]|uniref:Transcription regulator protein, response regulator containing CheY-like receiver domain and HTH DNA-binding domain n=1 Tax=Legionella wadsworthii TaxID=28088 RepID=A0A378LY73_9GAMM|nr:helix-turn-helix transcriptional regulator [Legionella wadsworthii]STY31736.1 transcription regulator protein, response regulator containing CheY-like receiver domain and HTH DNA-binding domain [Legionella wadsworthii]